MNFISLTFDKFGLLKINNTKANIYYIVLGSFLIAVLAQFSIPVPFSPVPITGQTIGVVLVGGILGSIRGSMSILCYLMEGAIGIPVFAQMKGGAAILIGPTAGYLWGFVFAAFLIGYLAEIGLTNTLIKSFASCFAATTLILITGTLYLAIFNDIYVALKIGFYPFLVGDVVKSAICSFLILSIRKL